MIENERGAGYEFVDKIFGGAIDQAYRPGVDKGVRAQMAEGVLAGRGRGPTLRHPAPPDSFPLTDSLLAIVKDRRGHLSTRP